MRQQRTIGPLATDCGRFKFAICLAHSRLSFQMNTRRIGNEQTRTNRRDRPSSDTGRKRASCKRSSLTPADSMSYAVSSVVKFTPDLSVTQTSNSQLSAPRTDWSCCMSFAQGAPYSARRKYKVERAIPSCLATRVRLPPQLRTAASMFARSTDFMS